VIFDAIKVGSNLTSEIHTESTNFQIPEVVSLSSAFPNPFNSTVVIGYELKNDATVELELVDLFGRKIIKNNTVRKAAGTHYFSWDGKNDLGETCPSGVYLFSISSGGISKSKKTVFLK
jgi:hypothetical protein